MISWFPGFLMICPLISRSGAKGRVAGREPIQQVQRKPAEIITGLGRQVHVLGGGWLLLFNAFHAADGGVGILAGRGATGPQPGAGHHQQTRHDGSKRFHGVSIVVIWHPHQYPIGDVQSMG